MKVIKGVNDLNTELTYETLKKYKGFENITEEQAVKEIEVIKRLAKILHCLYVSEQQNTVEPKDNLDYESDSEQFGT